MYQKRIEKRNQEEEEEEREEDWEEEEEEQEEKIRRGLSNKRYVCSCIIENISHILLIIDLLYTDGRRMGKMTTENENPKRNLHQEKR